MSPSYFNPQAQFDIYLVYRELTGRPIGFDLQPAPKRGDRIIREGAVPGMFGHPIMYISHVRGKIEVAGKNERPTTILVIAYTEKPMTQAMHDDIVKRAWEYVEKTLGLK